MVSLPQKKFSFEREKAFVHGLNATTISDYIHVPLILLFANIGFKKESVWFIDSYKTYFGLHIQS